MSTISRVLLTPVLCTAAVACSKKIKELQPADTGPSTGVVAQTGPTTPGAYGPGDLDTDACLRHPAVYRSEERRVGTGAVGRVSTRCSPLHTNKTNNTNN